MESLDKELLKKLDLRYKVHPWHGISAGKDAPSVITAFIEITPMDTIKYEIDKVTGYLKVDRPQKFSNVIPSLYGFIPQTYSGKRVAKRCEEISDRKNLVGDGDPLDICVLTEKHITHGDILLQARPIGGIRLIDKGEVDDKIIAVMKTDEVFGAWRSIADCPEPFIMRLKHYFLTYKELPGSESPVCEINDVYDAEEAERVIALGMQDYQENFG